MWKAEEMLQTLSNDPTQSMTLEKYIDMDDMKMKETDFWKILIAFKKKTYILNFVKNFVELRKEYSVNDIVAKCFKLHDVYEENEYESKNIKLLIRLPKVLDFAVMENYEETVYKENTNGIGSHIFKHLEWTD